MKRLAGSFWVKRTDAVLRTWQWHEQRFVARALFGAVITRRAAAAFIASSFHAPRITHARERVHDL